MQAGSAGASAEKRIQSTIAKTPMVSQSMPHLPCLYIVSGGHLDCLLLLLDLSMYKLERIWLVLTCKLTSEASAALQSSTSALTDLIHSVIVVLFCGLGL